MKFRKLVRLLIVSAKINSLGFVFLAVGEASLEYEGDSVLVIRKPGVLISEDWEIEIA